MTDVQWREAAAEVEAAVLARHLRRIGGVVPGTRLARIAWPRARSTRVAPWHYWWQAHLVDCLVDAHRREPRDATADLVAALVRGVRLRNGWSWTNDYYDDVAWFALAVQRAGDLAGPAGPAAVATICEHLRRGWNEDAGGGLWWRRGDTSKNAPANGPAAILLARAGDVPFAVRIVDWMEEMLVDAATGVVADGVFAAPDGGVLEVDHRVFSYCQGVYLGACVELAELDGAPRWADRARRTVAALRSHVTTAVGVLPGVGGGDGGLFAGITARYLADAALRAPLGTPAARHAADVVLRSAEGAWAGRLRLDDGPVLAADWRSPVPAEWSTGPEADLSVQLGGWMLLEAAARLERDGV